MTQPTRLLSRWAARTALAALLAGGTAAAQTPAPVVPLAVPVVPPVSLPDAPAPAPCPAACDDACGGFDFKNVPPVRPATRPGMFPNPPTGPGYYSLLDVLTGECRQGPPKYPYPRFALMPPSFFDADFRYLDDPNNTEHDYLDPLKRIRLGNDWLLSLGGQGWTRYMNEHNSRLGATDNTYYLARSRLYADLWYKDQFRVFAEGIYAYSEWQDLPPLPIDRTGPDILNLFVDVKLTEVMNKPVYARIGRQELTLGSQRLVSALDWANTRRTFQGASVLRTGEQWDFTAFWLQPVIPNSQKLDWADNQQHFAGGWLTYRPKKGTTVDLYDLVYVNNNTVAQQGIQRGNFTINTLGGRYAGDQDHFLWDFESALQLGTQAGNRVLAGMATAGLGYHFHCLPWNPTLWQYIDYASGDSNPRAGQVNTFNQLFPFAHYYMGWADLIGRQNIVDLNTHLYAYPAKWLTLNLQYHRFWLANRTDALYNIAGAVSRFDPTGRAGRDVGHEVDAIGNIHLSKHSDLMVGYSYLFSGRFLERTAPAGQVGGSDSGTFFVMYNFRW